MGARVYCFPYVIGPNLRPPASFLSSCHHLAVASMSNYRPNVLPSTPRGSICRPRTQNVQSNKLIPKFFLGIFLSLEFWNAYDKLRKLPKEILETSLGNFHCFLLRILSKIYLNISWFLPKYFLLRINTCDSSFPRKKLWLPFAVGSLENYPLSIVGIRDYSIRFAWSACSENIHSEQKTRTSV